MARPVLYGADYSVYVRIARMALAEKGVEHDLVPVDIFAPGGPPAWYRERHPFLKIPAFEHGDLRLFETSVIARYIDEAFPGPSLQPVHAGRRAVMNQIIGMLDAYGYRAMVWDVAVGRLEGDPPDEARIAAGLRTAETTLKTLSRLEIAGDWLIGDKLTLADLHAMPIITYLIKAPEGRALLAQHPALLAWWERMAARPSFTATGPTG
jgi:glutathione S-transferase